MIYTEIAADRSAVVRLYSIGHSNRSLEDFLHLVGVFHIEVLADIRSFPGSRHFPHFNKDRLMKALAEEGTAYVWLPRLGGRRSPIKGPASPNTGLTSAGFRNYADYMLGAEFREGVRELLEQARSATTAFMCAEAVYWKCHRRLLSDYLTAKGMEVIHILGPGEARTHSLSDDAVIASDGSPTYPARPDVPEK